MKHVIFRQPKRKLHGAFNDEKAFATGGAEYVLQRDAFAAIRVKRNGESYDGGIHM